MNEVDQEVIHIVFTSKTPNLLNPMSCHYYKEFEALPQISGWLEIPHSTPS